MVAWSSSHPLRRLGTQKALRVRAIPLLPPCSACLLRCVAPACCVASHLLVRAAYIRMVRRRCTSGIVVIFLLSFSWSCSQCCLWLQFLLVEWCCASSCCCVHGAIYFCFFWCRLENLELMLKYGTNTWKVHNQHLEAFQARWGLHFGLFSWVGRIHDFFWNNENADLCFL
jgi:hypothetical protein